MYSYPTQTKVVLFNATDCRQIVAKSTNLIIVLRLIVHSKLRTTKHKWSSGFMVLDVSYSRVLGQRPTFYCPLLAVSCPEVWARMYRLRGRVVKGVGHLDHVRSYGMREVVSSIPDRGNIVIIRQPLCPVVGRRPQHVVSK